MKHNFTSDEKYRQSLYYRFFTKKIKSSDNIDLIKYYDGINCFQFFDFDINEKDIIFLKHINKYAPIKFRNINKCSNVYNIINDHFCIEITEEWDAPIINIKRNEFDKYVSSKSNDFRRLMKKCNILSKKMKFKTSNKNNINDLWKDVLTIDQSSWKNKEKSDMMNLYYEHLSYVSLQKHSIIEVAYLDDVPVAYSLLLLYNNIYYAAKWGATEIGRKHNAGIICLLKQIKKISSKKDIYMDLWGRENKIYDRLKTETIKRIYFVIKKNGSKKDRDK